MALTLVKGASSYTLPTYTSISGLDYDVRTKQEDRAFSHGSIEIGDGKVAKRIITLDIDIFGTSASNHDSQWDALNAALMRQDQILNISATRYINIARLDKLKHKYYNGYVGIRSNVVASLLANDPFFYSVTASQSVNAISASPTTISITNAGTIDCPLKVTIAASADCSDINIVNTTDGNCAFDLTDALLVSGQTAIINPELGTVYRGTSNAINAFSGSFLRLLPGANSITYTGGNCTLTFDYTQRYL